MVNFDDVDFMEEFGGLVVVVLGEVYEADDFFGYGGADVCLSEEADFDVVCFV